MADCEMDDNNMICPYCGCENHVEDEDFSEDERVEECCDCGLKFHGYQSFTVSHHSKPDCELNKEEHNWVFDACYAGTEFEKCLKCSEVRSKK